MLSSPETLADRAGANADVLRRCRSGDTSAFSELVEEHYAMIYRTAWRWCGNQSDAEDVAQDTCVRLASAISGYDGRSSFTTWLYRITINIANDLHRSRSRAGKRLFQFHQEPKQERPERQDEALETRDLWAAVDTLPERQRDAILLVYAEELSHAEAATVLGCNEKTVSWHIHEARKTLRGLL